MAKVTIKTLEELLLTKGVTSEMGCISKKGERYAFPRTMFHYCGKEVEGELTTKGNLGLGTGEYIERWMCSSWERNSKQDKLDNFESEIFKLKNGNWIKVDINQSNVKNFIEREQNIFIKTSSLYLGINIEEWLAINKKVNEIVKLKAELLSEETNK